ncbi:MAG: response regulator, partial [Clostridiales bacterium]
TKDIQIGINNLIENMEKVKKGNVNIEIKNNRKDEFGLIMDNFSEMVDKIKIINNLKDDFLSNTSHELRTPINGIIGLSESVLKNSENKLSPKAHKNINIILSISKRLSSLIDDILDYSKLKNRDINLNKEKIDMKYVVEAILNALKETIGKKQIELINDISIDTPYVLADENRLQQILYNLIGNAIKFTEKGYLRVSNEIIDNYTVVCVEDTGIGISKDKLEGVFKNFEQLDNSVGVNYNGTGLGLNITKKLVELHDGEVWVESIRGKGSKFYFTLPVLDESIVNIQSSKNNKKLSIDEIEAFKEEIQDDFINYSNYMDNTTVLDEDSNVDNNNIKILIVDDESINLKTISKHLTVQKYYVEMALDGFMALEKIKNKKFDLIITDISMPKMTGFELCMNLRKVYTNYELPIIILTSKNQSNDIVKGFNLGANDYIVKPFKKEELLVRVKLQISLKKTFKNLKKEKNIV